VHNHTFHFGVEQRLFSTDISACHRLAQKKRHLSPPKPSK
jgi:hypothetical protein